MTWPAGVWCGEKLNEWPRVHSCLNDWCPKESEHCQRCNKCCEILRTHRHEQEVAQLSAGQRDA